VRIKRFLSIAPLVLVLSIVIGTTWVTLPYYTEGPGPAREVVPLIHVDGPPLYSSAGTLIMTTVEYRQATAFTAFLAWLDPERRVISSEVLYPPGKTPEQEHDRSISEMDTSKIDAAYVVLHTVSGYPVDHGTGALIEGVSAGCPAEGKLFAGDLIVAMNGEAVSSRAEALRAFDAVPLDSPITFRVRAAGETHDLTLTRGRCVSGDPPIVGITMVPNFPYRIRIESGDVGGPSAGMMYALGLYDLLTPGDLTAGRIVAGTGTIDLGGTIGPIGGIGDKVAAAQAAGADIFLVPDGDLAGARAASDGSMEIVPVSTMQDALTYLRGLS
jgi:PDZ domain-containing protein